MSPTNHLTDGNRGNSYCGREGEGGDELVDHCYIKWRGLDYLRECEIMDNLILTMQFGSHLYGTDTPTSDRDFKGIYIPSKKDLYLGKIPKSIQVSKGNGNTKNDSTDMDHEVYSLHYFLKLAMEGQTGPIDMLHSEKRHWLKSSPIWEELVGMRATFYTRNLQAFVGYARTQAAKYGIKGSRLSAAKEAAHLLGLHGRSRVADIWHLLYENEHCHFLDNGVHRIWQVCGKGVSETAKCDLACEMLMDFIQRYGERAKKAESNQGIDWKAVSHALRAGYQARAIFLNGGFTFPLPEVEFLKHVKAGRLDYLSIVAPELERLMDELESLRAVSVLPEEVDRRAIEEWLFVTLEKYYE